MPIYEFHCSACGADFDQLVRRDSEAACPSCDSTTLERKISAAALPLMGGAAKSQASGPRGSSGGCCGGGCGCH
jgi:putative FmdB family regulatory protein